MPINGRRIDELPLTSGAALEASDLIHVLDSVAGGYTNKKVSVLEVGHFLLEGVNTNLAYLSSVIDTNTVNISSNDVDIIALSSAIDSNTSAIVELCGNYVTLDTVQSITATKTFSDVNIQGTLTATSAVYVTTENLAISANIFTLNNNITGVPTENAGIAVNRGAELNSLVLWDETLDQWMIGVSGNLSAIQTDITLYPDYDVSKYQALTHVSGDVLWKDTVNGFNLFIPLTGSNQIAGQLTPISDSTYSLGTSALQWKDLFVSSGSVYFDSQKLSVHGDGNIYVNDVLYSAVTQLSALSGFDANDYQALTNFSGAYLWQDVVNGSALYAALTDFNTLSAKVDTHNTSNGSEHTFINQSVTSGSTPTFSGLFSDGNIYGGTTELDSIAIYASDLSEAGPPTGGGHPDPSVTIGATQILATIGGDGGSSTRWQTGSVITTATAGSLATLSDTMDGNGIVRAYNYTTDIATRTNIGKGLYRIDMQPVGGTYESKFLITSGSLALSGLGNIKEFTVDVDETKTTLTHKVVAPVIGENVYVDMESGHFKLRGDGYSGNPLFDINMGLIEGNPTLRISADLISYNTTLLSGDTYSAGSIYGNNIVPRVTDTYSLGTSALQWKDLFLTSASIYFDNQKLSIDTGNIYVNNQLYSANTQLSAISGFDVTKSQSLTHVSGGNVWKDSLNALEYFARLSDFNNLSAKVDTHNTSDGSDHTFINQDVTSGATPIFNGLSANSDITISGWLEIPDTNAGIRVGGLTFGQDIGATYNAGLNLECQGPTLTEKSNIQQKAFNNEGGPYSDIYFWRGTKDSPSAILADDWIGANWYWGGYGAGDGLKHYVGGFTMYAAENFGVSNGGSRLSFETTPLGTTTPVESLVLSGNTNISRNIVPATTDTYSLGTSALQWKDLFLTSASVYFDNQKLSLSGGQIYIDDVLFESGIDLTTISGYNTGTTQGLTHVSGTNKWEDVTGIETIVGYSSTNTQLFGHISGESQFLEIAEFSNSNNWDSVYSTVGANSASWDESADITALSSAINTNTTNINDVTTTVQTNSSLWESSSLTEVGPSSGAFVISLSGDGAYEYAINGNSSFSVTGEEVGVTRSTVALISADGTNPSVSATFDSSWYWVGSRPTDDLATITSGNMIELVLRSSGTKIIAAYEDLV
jgi:hypothetical protein